MDFGFRVRGANGSIQIDQKYRNMVLLERGTANVFGVDDSGSGLVVVIAPSGVNAVVAIRSDYFIGIDRVLPDGNYDDHYFTVMQAPDQPMIDEGAEVDYFIFADPLTISQRPLPRFGMVVRTPDASRIVFRSDQPPCPMTDVQFGTVSGGGVPATSGQTYQAGRTYAIVPTTRTGYIYTYYESEDEDSYDAIFMTYDAGYRAYPSGLQAYLNNSSNFTSANYGSGRPPGPSTYYVNNWGCMIIDVTGL